MFAQVDGERENGNGPIGAAEGGLETRISADSCEAQRET
jgi:hypothetical protein